MSVIRIVKSANCLRGDWRKAGGCWSVVCCGDIWLAKFTQVVAAPLFSSARLDTLRIHGKRAEAG
jgi:hypothetical protein